MTDAAGGSRATWVAASVTENMQTALRSSGDRYRMIGGANTVQPIRMVLPKVHAGHVHTTKGVLCVIIYDFNRAVMYFL